MSMRAGGRMAVRIPPAAFVTIRTSMPNAAINRTGSTAVAGSWPFVEVQPPAGENDGHAFQPPGHELTPVPRHRRLRMPRTSCRE